MAGPQPLPGGRQPIGPGCLVLVVGPSGAGKDTLLAGARCRLASSGSFEFPTRRVTRPPDATEHVIAVSDADFAADELGGVFALSWRAHGLAYGVPVSIDASLRAGKTVVVNVSRTIVPEARRRYARVCVIMIEASAEVRAARLLARGREAVETVRGRLERGRDGGLPCEPDIVIDNSGDIEPVVRELTARLRCLEKGAAQ